MSNANTDAMDAAQTAAYAEGRTDERAELSRAVLDVLDERARQTSAEGYTTEHDDEHDAGELSGAGAAYAAHASDALYPLSCGDAFRNGEIPPGWCWEPESFKPSPSPRRNLVKAVALLLAEIERIDQDERSAIDQERDAAEESLDHRGCHPLYP